MPPLLKASERLPHPPLTQMTRPTLVSLSLHSLVLYAFCLLDFHVYLFFQVGMSLLSIGYEFSGVCVVLYFLTHVRQMSWIHCKKCLHQSLASKCLHNLVCNQMRGGTWKCFPDGPIALSRLIFQRAISSKPKSS